MAEAGLLSIANKMASQHSTGRGQTTRKGTIFPICLYNAYPLCSETNTCHSHLKFIHLGRFGNLYGDFWLGNAYLSLLSTHTDYSLQLQLTDWEGHSSWLHYHQFRVEGKDTGYKILTQR